MAQGRMSVSWTLFEGVPEISVNGELDIATAPELDEAICEARTADPFSLIISLEGCSYCDSSGLSVLLRHAHQVPNFVTVVPESSNVGRLFRIAKVEDVLCVVDGMLAARLMTHAVAKT